MWGACVTHECGGLRITYYNWFSPSGELNFGIKFRSKCLCLLSHRPNLKKIDFFLDNFITILITLPSHIPCHQCQLRLPTRSLSSHCHGFIFVFVL